MSLAGKRVLIVEDEVLIAMNAEDMLLSAGAEIVGPAATLAQATGLAETETLDAAVIDVNLNGTRSDPVVAILRARGIPVVLATGYGDGERSAGVPVLHKPYSQDGLLAILEQALAAARPD